MESQAEMFNHFLTDLVPRFANLYAVGQLIATQMLSLASTPMSPAAPGPVCHELFHRS